MARSRAPSGRVGGGAGGEHQPQHAGHRRGGLAARAHAFGPGDALDHHGEPGWRRSSAAGEQMRGADRRERDADRADREARIGQRTTYMAMVSGSAASGSRPKERHQASYCRQAARRPAVPSPRARVAARRASRSASCRVSGRRSAAGARSRRRPGGEGRGPALAGMLPGRGSPRPVSAGSSAGGGISGSESAITPD